ncbi:D-glucuronyl C5-epimerase family protein [Georgenia yuyongxinii]
MRRAGLVGVLATVALSLTGCVVLPAAGAGAAAEVSRRVELAQKPPRLSTSYRTSGFLLREIEPRPYDAERRDLDLADPEVEIDEDGVVVMWAGVDGKANGERWVHPVATAQYALHALASYHREGGAEYLRRATANAEALLAHGKLREGALWFPYDRDYVLGGVGNNVIRAPWYSGMAQGQALSLFVRMYEETGSQKWRKAADRTMESFLVERDGATGLGFALVEDGNLWFEEYAGNTEPLLVINGQNFALFGLYDYYVLTEDPRAAALFDAGATTVLEVFEDFREPGEISRYCVDGDVCEGERWQTDVYHMIHIHQLRLLGLITGEPQFERDAKILREDYFDPWLDLR